MLSFKQKGQEDGLAQKLSQIEGKLGLSLNGEQRQAVLTALGSPIRCV